MAETPNEANPERPGPKPKYLPRIVYQPPEPSPDDPAEAVGGKAAPRPTSTPKPAPKPEKKKPRPAEGHGVLLEKTPELDTYDSRRRVRMIVGSMAIGVLLLSLLMIARSLRPIEVRDDGPPVAGDPTRSQVTARPKESPKIRETQARQLLADARQFEKFGKLEQALDRVKRVLNDYAEVPSARLAQAASERHSQGLPLFVDGAAVIATRTEPEPPTEPAPTQPVVVVEATRSADTQPTPSEAGLATAPPGALAEPRRTTGVGLPRSDVAARALPLGFHARAEAGVHETGWPLEITCDRDGGSMVFIPGGVFTRGRDDGRPEERPAHKASLSPYYIDQHEVTATQFSLFQPEGREKGDQPAVQVNLAEARAYAEWAGKAIPTEAQWEMAARTSDGRFHPWGNSRAEWDRPRNPKQIDPVMSFARDLSPYGVFDLAGNAWEWTNDWFDTKAYAGFKGQVANNPTGPAKGKGRIPEITIKGGSKDWDASWRSGMRPEARLAHLGFRCVLNLDGAAGPGPSSIPGNRGSSATPGRVEF